MGQNAGAVFSPCCVRANTETPSHQGPLATLRGVRRRLLRVSPWFWALRSLFEVPIGLFRPTGTLKGKFTSSWPSIELPPGHLSGDERFPTMELGHGYGLKATWGTGERFAGGGSGADGNFRYAFER